MPFEAIETNHRQKQSRCSISYMRFKREGREAKGLPKLIVGIPRGMIGNFKVKQGATYEFHLGTGQDAGKARILAGGAGIAPVIFKQAIVFRFGYVPMLGNEIADKEFVDGRPVDGGFEIDLPAWFKPNAG